MCRVQCNWDCRDHFSEAPTFCLVLQKITACSSWHSRHFKVRNGEVALTTQQPQKIISKKWRRGSRQQAVFDASPCACVMVRVSYLGCQLSSRCAPPNRTTFKCLHLQPVFHQLSFSNSQFGSIRPKNPWETTWGELKLTTVKNGPCTSQLQIQGTGRTVCQTSTLFQTKQGIGLAICFGALLLEAKSRTRF